MEDGRLIREASIEAMQKVNRTCIVAISDPYEAVGLSI
jgi:hypothetical protein